MVSKNGWRGVAAGGWSLVVGTATPKLGTEVTDGGATLPDSLYTQREVKGLRFFRMIEEFLIDLVRMEGLLF